MNAKVLTPAQRDEIRVAASKAAEAAVSAAVKRFGDDPNVIATAVEGLLTGSAFAVWQRRTNGMTARRLKSLLRAILDRAHRLVTSIPV